MKSSGRTADGLLVFIERNWPNWYGLAAALLLVSSVLGGALKVISVPEWSPTPLFLAANLLVLWKWLRSRAVPRVQTGRIGFGVCISCGLDVNRHRFRQDFIGALRQTINSGPTGSRFHFMEMPEHLADRNLTPADVDRLQDKSRAHFFLHGQVRTSITDGKSILVIDLAAGVKCAPTQESNVANLSREFYELLPHRSTIDDPEDIFKFEVTTETIGIVSRYIIGIAAFLSADLEFSDLQYAELQMRVAAPNPDVPEAEKIRSRLPRRRIEVRHARAHLVVGQWEKTKSPELVREMGLILDELDQFGADDYKTHLLRSLYLFLARRDIDGALAALDRCKASNDATWRYNVAFLHGYMGDLDRMSKEYRESTKLQEEPGMFARIEDFLCWIVKLEPNRGHLYFGLGYLNKTIKGDYQQAREDFESFLKSPGCKDYPRHCALAKKYLKEMGRSLELRPVA